MHVEHDSHGFWFRLAENAGQHENDKIHGRVVIVVQEYFVEARNVDLVAGFLLGRNVSLFVSPTLWHFVLNSYGLIVCEERTGVKKSSGKIVLDKNGE
jgi:hypothetical protein